MHHSGLPFAIEPEREIHTHANLVLLKGERAYKLKKPVKFPFLDYSTLALRRQMVLNELQLNRRFAPDHYLGVCEVRENDGQLQFGPLLESLPPAQQGVVDYAVVMRRVADRDWLPLLIRDGRVKGSQLEVLIDHMLQVYAEFPADADTRAAGMPDQLRRNTVANIEECECLVPDCLSRERWQKLRGVLCDWFERHPQVFESRVAQDHIREVHGDLKPGNIAFVDGAPVVTDCIEFDPQLRRLDILCEISFLATGLEGLGAYAMARQLYGVYRELSGDRYPSQLRRYYQVHLASVMGKVTGLQCREPEVPLAQRQHALKLARHYFGLADFHAREPLVIAVMGIMGCGKSTVATAIAAQLGWPVKNSDIERKRLAGVDARERLPDSAYGAEMTGRTYRALCEAVPEAFPGVVLDAQFPSRALRQKLAAAVAAGGGHLLWVHCDAPDRVVIDRMRQREKDSTRVSDATAELLAEARQRFELPDPGEGLQLLPVDTCLPPAEIASRVIRELLGPDVQPELAMV